jgi:hypothetical protein
MPEIEEAMAVLNVKGPLPAPKHFKRALKRVMNSVIEANDAGMHPTYKFL